MAINTGVNPYSGGAVIFDQRPWMAFYERQQARQQAKDDAYENYFKDLNKNVTSTGMRSQDVPILLQKNQAAQQYFQQNRESILHPKLDGGKTYNQYMNSYQDQMATINESKSAMKAMDEVGKLKLNKDMSYVFDDPDFMNQIQKHELPIGDPNRKGIDLASISLPEKPIDAKEIESHNKYLTGGLKPDEIPGTTVNLPGFKTQTTITKQYGDDNLKVMGQRASDAYNTDKRWRAKGVSILKDITGDPVKYNQLNTEYKRLYGNDIDTPQEALIASDILANKVHSTEFKQGEDTYGRDLALKKMEHANARDLIAYRKSIDPNDTELNNSWVDNYWSKRVSEAKQGQPTIFEDPNNAANMKGAHEITLDGVAAKAFARNGTEPDKLYVTADNKILPVFFKYKEQFDEKTGKKTGTTVDTNTKGEPKIDEDYSKPMDMDQAYLSLGYKGQTKKQLAGTMKGVGKAAAPNPTLQAPKHNIEDLRKKYDY
jgi:hypothetical protein